MIFKFNFLLTPHINMLCLTPLMHCEWSSLVQFGFYLFRIPKRLPELEQMHIAVVTSSVCQCGGVGWGVPGYFTSNRMS